MKYFYGKVPDLGNVVLSRHSQARAEEVGFNEAMVRRALFEPDGKDIPDGPGIVLRDRGLLRLVVILRPEPYNDAALVKTIIRKQPQAKAK